MDRVEINESDLGIEENEVNATNRNNPDIINIALFGIDTRSGSYANSLADTIMIATVDLEHNKLKLTSVMRDLYVNLPEKGYNKINASYSFGGPTLAIKTLNTNFDLNIRDFATVNFEAMEKIVDSVGGVRIDVKASELDKLNEGVREINRLSNKQVGYVKSAGLQTLNGRQAVAYSRIRKVGQGDFERTERQREVLEQVLNSVLKDKSITKAMRFADSLLPYVQTSMTRSEILSLGTKVLTSGATDLVNTRIPLDDHLKNASVDGASVLLPKTLIDNTRYLHNFIYENDDFTPSARLEGISKHISTK